MQISVIEDIPALTIILCPCEHLCAVHAPQDCSQLTLYPCPYLSCLRLRLVLWHHLLNLALVINDKEPCYGTLPEWPSRIFDSLKNLKLCHAGAMCDMIV